MIENEIGRIMLEMSIDSISQYNPKSNKTPDYSHIKNLEFIAENYGPWYIPETKRKALYQEAVQDLDKGKSNIAGNIHYETSEPIRHICSNSSIDRQIRVPIIKWMIGSVARHQSCIQCGAELSREQLIN